MTHEDVPPSPETVETLQLLLVQAQSGQLRTLAFTAVYQDDTCEAAVVGEYYTYQIIGRLEQLKFDLMVDERITERDEEDGK